MYRSRLGALLLALPLFATAFGQTAAPQFALIDLGPTTIAGSGLPWQARQSTPAPSSWPSTGGNACSANYIYVEYGSVAVGSTCQAGMAEHAAKWTNSAGTITLTDLGVLPGAISGTVGGPDSEAWGFNNVGDIVGGSYSSSGSSHAPYVAQHAFLYNSGGMTDLGVIAGPEYNSLAEAVNDSHEIVGTTNTLSSADGSVLSRAFLYTNGTMYNLTFYLVGGPTVLLSDAYWIDCQGHIAAVGTPASGGNTHSYLLVRQGAARACQN